MTQKLFGGLTFWETQTYPIAALNKKRHIMQVFPDDENVKQVFFDDNVHHSDPRTGTQRCVEPLTVDHGEAVQ